MLTADRLLGAVVLVKAVDLVDRGATDLPGPLWLLALLVWVTGGLGLVAQRSTWVLVLVSGVALAYDSPLDLRRQHLVLIVGLALAAVVAADDRECLLLWRTQLTALYGFAVLAKLNESFLTGNVVALEVSDGPLWFLLAGSAVLVLAEVGLAVGLWTRPRWGLLLAVAFHGGALLVLSDTFAVGLRLVVFGGASVVAYAACAGALPLRRPVAASVQA